MKTIEEGAKEYSISSYPNALDMQFACEMHFEAGAEWMRKELTRWHDPKEELPQRNIDVLVKLRDTYKGDKIHYSVGYINGACWFGDSIGATDDVIGWREIHE